MYFFFILNNNKQTRQKDIKVNIYEYMRGLNFTQKYLIINKILSCTKKNFKALGTPRQEWRFPHKSNATARAPHRGSHFRVMRCRDHP